MLNIQSIANFINQILPFVLFLILPFLHNEINGYSIVISLVLSAIFFLASGKKYKKNSNYLIFYI